MVDFLATIQPLVGQELFFVFNCLSSRGEEFPLPKENPMDVGCGKCILTIYVHSDGFATHIPRSCKMPGLMPGGQCFVLISLS